MEETHQEALLLGLLSDYDGIYAKRESASLPNTVVRSFSEDSAALLAFHVFKGEGGFDDLAAVAETGRFPEGGADWSKIPPARLAMAARVFALRADDETGFARALRFYDLILRTHGAEKIPDFHQGLHLQVAFHRREFDRVRRLLKTYRRAPAQVRSVIELNLENPVVSGRDWDPWFARLQGFMPPARYSMSTEDPALPPLDRLRVEPLGTVRDGAKVTVVVTCFEPDDQLVTAVRSVAAQSWQNLDILIVDDGSSEAARPVLKVCEALDDRVRVVRLDQNCGTYHARNVGMDLAEGEYLTFQDADDWSHPDRIEHLLRPLLSDPAVSAVLGDGLKTGSDLLIDRVGRPLVDVSMPTTMFRLSELRDRLGYFHEIRRSADGEYLDRIRAVFGENAVHRERAVAYKLIRQTADSLSRKDFGAGGWVHPAREAYASATRLWHKRIAAREADPYLPRTGNRDRIPAHPHLAGGALNRRSYDFVFATDWRPFGAPAKAILEEVKALKASGRTVGILHLETHRYMSAYVRPLCDQVQELVNDGVVDRVLPGDDVEVGTLMIRYPPVLQFRPEHAFALRAERVVVLANQAPAEKDGSDRRYIAAQCDRNAREMFGAEPLWLPEGPQTREALLREGTLPESAVAPATFPCVVDPREWAMPRTRFRSDRPVIGRHSRDHYTKWPETGAELLQVYPDDPAFDVRVMGGASTPASLLDGRLPGNWISFGYDAMSVKAFLYQLDFWIYFHHPVLVESFGLAVLEAMATGCVVILPEHFEPTFGSGALYCRPDQVLATVREHYADFAKFKAQSERGLRTVQERFSHGAMLERLEDLSLLVLSGAPMSAAGTLPPAVLSPPKWSRT